MSTMIAGFISLRTNLPNSTSPSRRWTVIAAGLLIGALTLVVTYTNRSAFLSPLAVVVISAIGLAAVLLQLRFRRDLTSAVHAPVWLNVLGLLFGLPALFADFLRLGSQVAEIMAPGPVGSCGTTRVVSPRA